MLIKELRESRKIPQKELAIELNIPPNSLSQYENGKREPSYDLIKRIANYFDVTIDFILGNNSISICPICGFGDNPLSEQSRNEHEEFHKKFLEIKEKFQFFMNWGDADKLRSDSVFTFRNPSTSFDEKLDAFDNYLKADFSLEIIRSNYEYEHLNYEHYCKVEVGTLERDDLVSQDIIDALIRKYGINRDFLSGNEQLIAIASKNDQIMRLISYAERLSPELLDSLEIQVKALSEQNKKE